MIEALEKLLALTHQNLKKADSFFNLKLKLKWVGLTHIICTHLSTISI